jgi:Fic family protein
MGLWFESFGDLQNDALSLKEALERYTSAHIAFTSIHPFFDGNGRLARLVSNLVMLKNGYLPIIISNENRYEYINLLSSYNLHSPRLDNITKELIEKNSNYKKLYDFFAQEYDNSLKILKELKEN